MLASQIPTKFTLPFAQAASGPYTRTIPVTTTDPNAASLTLGFPPNTFVNIDSGGEEPDGRDFNGLFNQITAWTRWQNAGGPIFYDAGFSASIGGYPQGAVLVAAGNANLWLCQVDNNTSDPDTGGANWIQVGGSPNLTALFASAVQNETWIYVHDTGTADGLVLNPSPAVTAYVAGLRLSVLKSGLGNATTTPTANVNSLGAKAIVRSDGSPLQVNDMPAGALFDLEYDGTKLRLLEIQPSSIRTRLSADTTFYVSTTGSDVSGTGAQTKPWATIQHAFNAIYEAYDLAGFAVTIQLANGVYTAGVLWDGLFLGQVGPITLLGNRSSPGSVIINVPGAPCFHFRFGANVFIVGFRLLCGIAGLFGGMMSEYGAYMLHDFCWFDAHPFCYHMYANFGTIACLTQYWIFGDAIAHHYITFGGAINIQGCTVNISGTRTFGVFCQIPNGNCYAIGAVFLGGIVHAQRYLVSFGSLVNTGGGGANFFPGNASGSAPTGYYI